MKEDAMKSSRFSVEQILKILQEAEAGTPTKDLSRQYGVSQWTIYRWRQFYGGMQVPEAKRLKALEEENRQLKHLVGELSLENRAMKAVISKKR
jgi:putative transposase